jgi:RHS repeat-associated protein
VQRRFITFALTSAFLPVLATSRLFAQEVDLHNPIGITGIFNGNVTTGCSYDPLSHSTHRAIDDIVVPGSIGKYPLKMTRYYNSRHSLTGSLGPGWSHEYQWGATDSKVTYPNGNVLESFCQTPVGISDYWETRNPLGGGTFRLSDGGKVVFDQNNRVTSIIDPYGQTTTITFAPNGSWMKVTEPGGRYLYFTYAGGRLSRVEAHGLGNATVTDSVNYHYDPVSPGGNGASVLCLTRVDYGDGPPATYTYTQDNVQAQYKVLPLLATANDVRYNGPMRQIAYSYQGYPAPHGAIVAEKYGASGPNVSSIAPGATLCTSFGCTMETDFTETRGDTHTRTFHYTNLHYQSNPQEPGCPEVTGTSPPSQFLLNYTDFQTNTTYLGYDENWYVDSVRDANVHTTSYVRGSPPPNGIGEILKIIHPGGTHIDYTYSDHGHYVGQITDERGNVTFHWRESAPTHRITRTDYKDASDNVLAFENFTYNNFGQVLTHRLKNGAYESFAYDTRGLLTDKWNPKQTTPGGTDPHTHYDYYTAADGNLGWIDRVKTVTLPANVSGNVASETYEYDRALDANGVTNLNGAAVGGRGLVTKITHADGKYQRFKYDAYGNKRWEDNELRKITQYTYDYYNRLLSVTDPLNKITQYDYSPTQGNATQSQQHTTNSPWWLTMPTGILTHNVYDENWRKTSSTPAYGTLNPTTFIYDNVGNLTDMTDPRGKITHNGYDNRNRKTSTTEASGTPVAATTVWHYDAASNINRIDRPDGKQEAKGYDALNRMIWHIVPRQVPGPSPAPTPINLITRVAYNPSGTIDHVTDPRNKIISFQYNASDERITMTYPGGTQSQSWVYDNAHNLASRTTVHGAPEIQHFTYDNRNRKTGMTWDNTADWANFGYDYAGRLTSAQNANSTVTRQYDDAGHLTLDQQNVTGLGSSKSVNYPSYDNDGRLLQMNVGGAGYDYTYSYDAAGRFEKIKLTSNGSVQFQYAYDAASNEIDRYAYLPNIVTIDQHYYRDSLNRMGSRLVKKNGAAFSAEAYTYNRMNHITEVARGSLADGFGYYWDGELLSAQYGGQPRAPYTEGQDPDLDTTDNIDPNAGYQPPDTEEPEPTPPPDDYSDLPVAGFVPPALPGGRSVTYYLDRAGNRQQVTDSSNPTATYTANNINQYSSVSGCSISNGNEHEVSSFQGLNDPSAVTYNYVNDEHLKQISDGTNNYYLYYDALGRCVRRNLNNNSVLTTYYIYDGEKPILEYSSTGIVGRNVYGKGIDEILMRTNPGANGGQPYYYAQDHEGSVTHLINGCSTVRCGTGDVIESYKYDAFGEPTIYGGNTRLDNTAYNNRFLFTGREYAATYRQQYVPTFTFYEYRARAYHPTLGRFMSEDPKLFDAGDYNLFRYCQNDPIDFTDPMGTEDAHVDPWPTHAQQAQALDRLAATRELLGLSSTYIRAALSAQDGSTMAQISRQESQTMYSYSLKSQYKIGDLSGFRGYQYVWDPDPNCSGQCMTTVQHTSGAPSSRTPLLRGNPVGPNTKQRTAIATGFELRNGQWVYPSRPAKESNNHAAFYVAPLGRGLMQTLEAQHGMSIHLSRQSMDGWYEITSRLPPRTTSTSELHASGGLYGPFY